MRCLGTAKAISTTACKVVFLTVNLGIPGLLIEKKPLLPGGVSLTEAASNAGTCGPVVWLDGAAAVVGGVVAFGLAGFCATMT